MQRSKNAVRNIVSGTALKIYQMLVPFVIRTLMIYSLGVQYVGLNSLFSSILQVLNLAELGVGAAMVFSMYKPIADNDSVYLSALLNLYRRYYRIIGMAILVVGILIVPVIPSLIKGSVPNTINIYVIYLMNLSATVLSYWLFAYKSSLLVAHQRSDIINKVTIITNTIQYIIQVVAMIFLQNYYAYLIAVIFAQLLTNICSAVMATKLYPGIQPHGLLPGVERKAIQQRVKDVFTSKIGGVILNSADAIVISYFLGLTPLAVYNNYFYILTSVFSFITIATTSITAGLGNSIVTNSVKSNYKLFINIFFVINWIAGFCSVCLLTLYQPFMLAWVGKKLMLDYSVVICFSIYNYIWQINTILNTFKDAAGIWHADRFRPLTTAILNLALNLILVNQIGIYGVILSTVLSIGLLGLPWIIHNIFAVYFKEGLLIFVRSFLGYVVVTLSISIICVMVANLIQAGPIGTIMVRAFLVVLLYNFLMGIVYHGRPEFTYFMQMAVRFVRR